MGGHLSVPFKKWAVSCHIPLCSLLRPLTYLLRRADLQGGTRNQSQYCPVCSETLALLFFALNRWAAKISVTSLSVW